MVEQTIPVLDLGEFDAGSASEAVFVRTLGNALRDLGFFAVVGHQVDASLIRQAYAAAERFFTLPETAKRAYERPDLYGQRGFTRFGQEHAKDHPTPDLKEFWHVGREIYPEHLRADECVPNVWPVEVPEFRPVFSELYRQLDACAARLLEAVALYIGDDRSLLAEMAAEGNSVLRIIHYPPVPADAPPSAMRAAPHEDINFLTLLCEATADGLELQRRDGTWLPIRALPGQIVVDAADMLQNLTNGLLRSTTHRVVNPKGDRERRFSLPFFVHPRADVDLTPLPGCVAKTGGQARYPALRAGEYLAQRLREIGLAG